MRAIKKSVIKDIYIYIRNVRRREDVYLKRSKGIFYDDENFCSTCLDEIFEIINFESQLKSTKKKN